MLKPLQMNNPLRCWVVAVALLGCSSSHDVSSDASAPDSAVADAGTMDAAIGMDAVMPPDATDTGMGFTHDPANLDARTSCNPDGTADLFVEIYDFDVEGCVPPADLIVEDVLLVAVDDWDGESGVFEVGVETPRGQALAGRSFTEPGSVTGTVEIEVVAGEPARLAWDLNIGAGTTDLRTCGSTQMPCADSTIPFGTFSTSVSCTALEGRTLRLSVHPDVAAMGCAHPAEMSGDVLDIVVRQWDGGRESFRTSSSSEENSLQMTFNGVDVDGSIEVQLDAGGAPDFAIWHLVDGEMGRVDFSDCAAAQLGPVECESPPDP